MNEKYKRFIHLQILGHQRPLTDYELSEHESLFEEMKLKECDNCEGQGGKDFPSMKGYGWDWCECKKCEGNGILDLPNEIKVELIKIYSGEQR